MKPWRPRLGIWPHLLLAAAVGIIVAIGALVLSVQPTLRSQATTAAKQGMQSQAFFLLSLLQQGYSYGGTAGLRQAAATPQAGAYLVGARIVVVSAGGTTIFDTNPRASAACAGAAYQAVLRSTIAPPATALLCLPDQTAERVRQAEVSIVRSLAIPGGIGLLCALAAVLLINRRIAGPLVGLARAARRLGAGDLAARAPVGGPREIADVGGEFNRMAEQLGESEHARRMVVADVAHELRTPLTVLRGYVEALRDGLAPAGPETFGVIHSQTVALQHLVDDLQDLATAEGAGLRLERDWTDVAELLTDAAAGFTLAAAAAGITLEVVVPPGLPPVLVDRQRIDQVVHNLIANALRYTPRGGRIRLAAESGGGICRVEVADTGSGIAPEHIERIFERFYRIDTSRARNTGGSGLGLTIARRIIAAHGGEIGVFSAPGDGSRFWFTLPVG